MSDQFGCPCGKDEFACDCIENRTCAPQRGCWPHRTIQDNFIRCPSERIPFGKNGRIFLHRLNDSSECNESVCDNSTCKTVNKSVCIDNKCYSQNHVICTSKCATNESCSVFQCDDNGLILLSQFCDTFVDCKDGSDEVVNQPGFKCNKCVLPQNNLYDNLAQCDDGSDACFGYSSACFRCLDERLYILSDQICDGKFDCYDLSDECLCEQYFDLEVCKSEFEKRTFQCFNNGQIKPSDTSFNKSNNLSNSKSSLINCTTKHNSSFRAITCDQRPECKDYSDECGKCPNPPSFCNDTCHSIFLMGDRYCDGIEDPAWEFINNPDECPKGFEEQNCPRRFACRAKERMSIDELQVCNGIMDCDDNSDEQNCYQTSFSSDTEMIDNPAINAAIWIIGIMVVSGNLYVIFNSIVDLRQKKKLQGVEFQQIIILNISIADFIMGIYLLSIAAYNASFSGFYGVMDREWRSSLNCSIIGSLVVISSQASCFLMVVLTAFRLINIVKAIESLTSSSRRWIVCIVMAWAFSFILSAVPLFSMTSSYFMHRFSISSAFYTGTLNSSQLTEFACRVATLTNTTIAYNDNELESALEFVQSGVLENFSVVLFGYYGQTSICMPRFYVTYGDTSWEYTTFIITVNFLSFVFIAFGYIWIVRHSSKSSASVQQAKNNRPNTHTAKMQRRVARIIATDFFCWIPICIMAYVRLGVEFSDIVYQISAVLLLPINSALNPFLFTSLPDKLVGFFRRQYEKVCKSE